MRFHKTAIKVTETAFTAIYKLIRPAAVAVQEQITSYEVERWSAWNEHALLRQSTVRQVMRSLYETHHWQMTADYHVMLIYDGQRAR